jgi:hypothetical protein
MLTVVKILNGGLVFRLRLIFTTTPPPKNNDDHFKNDKKNHLVSLICIKKWHCLKKIV